MSWSICLQGLKREGAYINKLWDTDVYKIIDIKEININIWRLMEQIRNFLEGGILEEVFRFQFFSYSNLRIVFLDGNILGGLIATG